MAELINGGMIHATGFSSGRRYQAAKSISEVNIYRCNESLWDG